MKNLFGSRQNINPSYIAEVGIAATSFDVTEVDDDADNPESV